jgi:CRISPR-associated endonuclease/helicase Cas3
MKLWGKFHTTKIELLQHTRDVVEAGDALFGSAELPTRLGECWLRFFKLPRDQWTRFYWNLLAAELLHDWGKANDGMQRVLTGNGKGEQAIRHEHFSALLIAYPEVWTWLGRKPELDREVILSAVLTHHLKASGDDTNLYAFGSLGNGKRQFKSLHTEDEFHQLVRETARRLNIIPGPDLSDVPVDWAIKNIEPERKRIKRCLNTLRMALDDGDAPRRRLLHAIRAALIAADAAGSGLRRTGQTIPEWVCGTLDESKTWDASAVREKVIEPRMRQVEALRGEKFKWNDFQDHCADPDRVPPRALLLAPCGSGKTLAAWRWIEQQAKRRVGHVLFLYPTRATATEGFRDYVSWAPEAEVSLMHGTSEFDLERIFDNAPDEDDRKKRVYTRSEAEDRLFALGYWGRRAFSATVDQFLAFLQYGYGPVCMLPVLSDSVVVIDEVHSFDNKMFSALKAFLNEFDVPVLCMTATLPTNRRDELVRGCGLKAYPDGELPPDLKEVAERPRYRLRRVSSRKEAETAVRDALGANKRVLWVVNQVKRAHAVVAAFVPQLPAEGVPLVTEIDGRAVPVICYHSRFKLDNRVTQHKATMKALKDSPRGEPALGLTTQVCEMSLDIDVDLLVTEDCPVTALVQRMGRCNRAQTPRPLGLAGDVLVYKPDDDAPYLKKSGSDPLAGLEAFLNLVDGRDLSQDDLEANLRKVDPPPTPGYALSMFLESGPYALAGEEEFRDSEEFNRPCVLPGEVDKYNRAKRSDQPGFVVPVPWKHAKGRDLEKPDHKRLPAYLGVASDGHYHHAVGFCDNPLTEWGAK